MGENKIRVGIIMDPIASIKPAKDSTLAMMLAAQRRDWRLLYMEQGDLVLRDGVASAGMREIHVVDDPAEWYRFGESFSGPLGELDIILMRKDPPFDMEFVYTTYILERAAAAGALVVNRPASLRDISEKVFTAWFPEQCPATLVTRSMRTLRQFAAEHGRMVVKPLDGMGGQSVFVVDRADVNASVIFETITEAGTRFAMAQQYIPQITLEGDKRILLVNGMPVPYALARIPAAGESRGNLAAGARAEGRPLTDADRAICAAVGPELRDRGVLFAGLDVIGDRLTEINVTSPTCIRELDRAFDLDIAGDLMGVLAGRLAAT